MASSNKDDSSIIDTTKSKSSLNVIRGDSQQQHTEYNIETDSIQEYEPSLNDESNSRLSNVGDKVVETVKHGVRAILGTSTDKSNQEQKTQRPLTDIRSDSPSSKIARQQISETEEEYLFIVS